MPVPAARTQRAHGSNWLHQEVIVYSICKVSGKNTARMSKRSSFFLGCIFQLFPARLLALLLSLFFTVSIKCGDHADDDDARALGMWVDLVHA